MRGRAGGTVGVVEIIGQTKPRKARSAPPALRTRPVPLGCNVGINKEGADPERDYPALIAAE